MASGTGSYVRGEIPRIDPPDKYRTVKKPDFAWIHILPYEVQTKIFANMSTRALLALNLSSKTAHESLKTWFRDLSVQQRLYSFGSKTTFPWFLHKEQKEAFVVEIFEGPPKEREQRKNLNEYGVVSPYQVITLSVSAGITNKATELLKKFKILSDIELCFIGAENSEENFLRAFGQFAHASWTEQRLPPRLHCISSMSHLPERFSYGPDGGRRFPRFDMIATAAAVRFMHFEDTPSDSRGDEERSVPTAIVSLPIASLALSVACIDDVWQTFSQESLQIIDRCEALLLRPRHVMGALNTVTFPRMRTCKTLILMCERFPHIWNGFQCHFRPQAAKIPSKVTSLAVTTDIIEGRVHACCATHFIFKQDNIKDSLQNLLLFLRTDLDSDREHFFTHVLKDVVFFTNLQSLTINTFKSDIIKFSKVDACFPSIKTLIFRFSVHIETDLSPIFPNVENLSLNFSHLYQPEYEGNSLWSGLMMGRINKTLQNIARLPKLRVLSLFGLPLGPAECIDAFRSVAQSDFISSAWIRLEHLIIHLHPTTESQMQDKHWAQLFGNIFSMFHTAEKITLVTNNDILLANELDDYCMNQHTQNSGGEQENPEANIFFSNFGPHMPEQIQRAMTVFSFESSTHDADNMHAYFDEFRTPLTPFLHHFYFSIVRQ